MQNKQLNFTVLIILFFGWGFVTCLNDLLTPLLQELFQLNQFQANFVAMAFFTAYFVGSFINILCSVFGITFFQRLGYKGLILFGLTLSGIGCLIFIPAAIFKSYYLFLGGLFAIGFGFTYLQIAANPLVLMAGDAKTGASRLNLAQGFNSLATTVSPILGAYVFYELLSVNQNHDNLRYPYMFLALFFAVLAFIIYKFLKTHESHVINEETGKLYALNHSNLLFGALAIFFYVGSEVSIGTNLISYLRSSETVSLSYVDASKLLAFYWGGAMIGRFLAGMALGGAAISKKVFVMIFTAIALTVLILFLDNMLGEINMLYYVLFQILAIVLLLLSKDERVNLMLFALVNIINLIIGATLHNSWFAVWAILSIGVFNSVMFPNIFSLGLSNLGKYREQGSSFLVMMILGGALLPILQGHVADLTDIVTSYAVPIVGYVYIFFYAAFYSKKCFKLIK